MNTQNTVRLSKSIFLNTEMSCPAPENITDGSVAVATSPVLNDTAHQSCNAGYDLRGAVVRTCVALGPGLVGWHPVKPTCNRKSHPRAMVT